MKKVLFVANVVKTHILAFHVPYLKMFKEMGWETSVASHNDFDDPVDCVIPYCDHFYDVPFQRSPFKVETIDILKRLKTIMDENHFDIVHCHTPIAAAITRVAAINTRRHGTKVIYTTHGLHFYKGAPLFNWLVYYPLEMALSRYTDVIIAINKEDYMRVKKFSARKVYYVPGVGIDLKKFNTTYVDRNKKRSEIGVCKDSFVLLSVGELIPRKNHSLVLTALGELKAENKLEGIQYVICGKGDIENELQEKVRELKIVDHVHFLGLRRDISEICKSCDLFVFTSVLEGLPVALMEAMASGLPILCSNIRGNTDLIVNGENGLTVNNDPKEVADAILWMKDNSADRKRFSIAALQTIKRYDLKNVESEMKKIYIEGGVLNLLSLLKGQKIRKELHIPLDSMVVLSVGELNSNKNHQIAIETMSLLRKSGDLGQTYYVICGKGPLREELEQYAKELEIDDRVFFCGYRSDIPDFYQMADVFLFPSLREGLPVSVMESMASGTPVICLTIRGNTDLIENGVNGITLNNRLQEFSSAILYLKNHPDKRMQFAEEAMKTVQDYNLPEVIEKVKHIYGQTLNLK